VTEKYFRHISFVIGWQQHGGSGLTFSREDMLNMTLPELDFYAKKALKQRKLEAKAINDAHQAKSSKKR
jgi:hypothetical protein